MSYSPAKDDKEVIRPFEWLTSAASLKPFICKALLPDCTPSLSESEADDTAATIPRRTKRVLHLGCGSSSLGEHLLQDPEYGVLHVLNVDKDGETLDRIQQRWREEQTHLVGVDNGKQVGDEGLQFQCVDFCAEAIDAADGSFDLVVDKSTLDCAMCTDTTASLLVETYRLMRPGSGAYLLVSFHDKGLLQPLLQNLPGADWTVQHFVMRRQMESLIPGPPSCGEKNLECCRDVVGQDAAVEETGSIIDSVNRVNEGSGAWSSGSFEPDENYRRTVNVFICRKQTLDDGTNCAIYPPLDVELVYQHINATNDQWYKTQNPMLTSQRTSSLQQAFVGDRLINLQEAYNVLFTNNEREDLMFEYFVEDWQAFLGDHPELPKDELSFETAVAFLDEMQ
jgi:SAM-dependent methyltransferase